jgi:hypothetical protein
MGSISVNRDGSGAALRSCVSQTRRQGRTISRCSLRLNHESARFTRNLRRVVSGMIIHDDDGLGYLAYIANDAANCEVFVTGRHHDKNIRRERGVCHIELVSTGSLAHFRFISQLPQGRRMFKQSQLE